MSFYASLKDTTTAVLRDLGEEAIIRSTSLSGGNPDSTDAETPSTQDQTVRLAVFEVSPDRINGTNVLAGDFQVICSAPPVEITASDLVVCSRGSLTIQRLGKIAPAGTVVAYDMVCRG